MCPETPLLGETSTSEASEGLSAAGWSRTMGHGPCAGGQESVSSPVLVCVWGVCVLVSKHQAGPAGTSLWVLCVHREHGAGPVGKSLHCFVTV